MMKAPVYLRWEEAIRKYEIEENALRAAVEHGLVRAIRINGHIAVAEEDVRKLRDTNGEPGAELPEYIPLAQAARRYGIPEETLKRAVESGTIRAVQLGEEVAVREGDVEKIIIRREDFEHLRGKSIWVMEAARKYGVPNPTISNWAKRGFIRILGREGRKTLLDEADVAYCAAVYKAKGGRRGKWIFDKHGKPYHRKSPPREPEKVVVVTP